MPRWCGHSLPSGGSPPRCGSCGGASADDRGAGVEVEHRHPERLPGPGGPGPAEGVVGHLRLGDDDDLRGGEVAHRPAERGQRVTLDDHPVGGGARPLQAGDRQPQRLGGLGPCPRLVRMAFGDVLPHLAQVEHPEVVDDLDEDVAVRLRRHEHLVLDIAAGVVAHDLSYIGVQQRVLGQHDDGLRHGSSSGRWCRRYGSGPQGAALLRYGYGVSGPGRAWRASHHRTTRTSCPGRVTTLRRTVASPDQLSSTSRTAPRSGTSRGVSSRVTTTASAPRYMVSQPPSSAAVTTVSARMPLAMSASRWRSRMTSRYQACRRQWRSCARSAQSSLLARKVPRSWGSGTSTSPPYTSAQPWEANSAARPRRIASASSGSAWSVKYWNGVRAPHSSPMKSMGV